MKLRLNFNSIVSDQILMRYYTVGDIQSILNWLEFYVSYRILLQLSSYRDL